VCACPNAYEHMSLIGFYKYCARIGTQLNKIYINIDPYFFLTFHVLIDWLIVICAGTEYDTRLHVQTLVPS
jgi:hypothetical protein